MKPGDVLECKSPEEIERVQAQLNKALKLYNDIKIAKQQAGMQFLKIGQALKIINNEQLYQYFDCETFEEFIGQPELGFKRATAFLFMRVYDIFIDRLGMDYDRISNVDISKLQLIVPIVEIHPEDKDSWVTKAETLGRLDLTNEVREWQGKEPIEEFEKRRQEYVAFKANYIEYVKSHPCVVCGYDTVDAHHFPRTKGAGGDALKVIPLCRICHTHYHNDPNEFLVRWKERIFDYFYDTFQKAMTILMEKQ